MKRISLAIVLMMLLGSLAAVTAPAQTKSKQPTTKEISSGLKEALTKGVRFAVDTLGRENGFLNDVRVKIPLPKSLQRLEKALRIAGQGKAVDEFVASMNHAAEKAVPVAFDVFVDAVRQMTFDDARKILFGEQDAATQFFRRTSEEKLRVKFRPIVEDFTEEVGVTQRYKDMVEKGGPIAKLLIGKEATDLDGYVTQKALDGLFFMVAEEEKKIRKDPLGRTTSLLKKVFGILK